MGESISIPLTLTPETWRPFATQLQELLNRPDGAIFVWNRGCVTVPTNTTISGAEEIVFPSDFTGNGTLVLTIYDAEGGVNIALNGVELGALTGTASQEVLYEVPVTNLVEGDNPLNVFKIWSTSADTAELRKLEVYRNFTREQISDSSIWGNITGTGKPADDATVGATAGTDLKDSGATVLNDADVKNDEQTFDDVSGASKPEDNATNTTGALGDKDTIANADIDNNTIEAAKLKTDLGVDLDSVVPGVFNAFVDDTDTATTSILFSEQPLEKFSDWTPAFTNDNHRITILIANVKIRAVFLSGTNSTGTMTVYRRTDGGTPVAVDAGDAFNVADSVGFTNASLLIDLIDSAPDGVTEYRVGCNVTGGDADFEFKDALINFEAVFRK